MKDSLFLLKIVALPFPVLEGHDVSLAIQPAVKTHNKQRHPCDTSYFQSFHHVPPIQLCGHISIYLIGGFNGSAAGSPVP